MSRVRALCVGASAIAALCLPGVGARAPVAQSPLFIESASAAGLNFRHVNGATGQYYMPEVMGAGVALFDYDADGDLDVFPVAHATTPAPTSRLFRNDLTTAAGGARTLRFTDVTARAWGSSEPDGRPSGAE